MSHAQWQGPTHTYTQIPWPSVLETACPIWDEHGPGSSDCSDKEGMFEGEERQSMMGDIAPCAPPPPLTFFTFILSRGCFFGLTQGLDRRHPLPVRPLN